ncbi:MAG: hypothetical protein HYZ37_15940 [Candidatus Solibacter usitatus]|nr:hypothetical protein [Candidatus Solibacter usitatus]
MINRRLFLLAGAAALAAGEREQIGAWLGTVVSRLREESAAEFLGAFEKRLRQTIDRNVWGLVRAAEVACSVEVVEIKASGSAQEIDADWFMELRPRAAATANEERRERVSIRVEKSGKTLMITGFSKPELFRQLN